MRPTVIFTVVADFLPVDGCTFDVPVRRGMLHSADSSRRPRWEFVERTCPSKHQTQDPGASGPSGIVIATSGTYTNEFQDDAPPKLSGVCIIPASKTCTHLF
mmetsp:Transcript_19299/g.37268  ORF Transcript_19299/g.37268 Transcript_19299/m.37268 type:complete len:102 (+) Transcript_19299:378-683(+)